MRHPKVTEVSQIFGKDFYGFNASPIVMLLNSRSLFHKMDELSVVAKLRNPEVICFTETCLNETVDSSLMLLESYMMHRTDRCHRRGGGVATYIRRDLDIEDITSQFEELENLEYFGRILLHFEFFSCVSMFHLLSPLRPCKTCTSV